MGQSVKVATSASTAEDVLQGTFGANGHFNTNIHPADQMLTFVASVLGSEELARGQYFRSGAQLMDVAQQLIEWKFGSFDNVSAFLDFAGGFGRFTRFLVQHMPADRIWVSDIQADAVTFQEEQFGVHGFISATNPSDLNFAEKFDCIFVASLFSHLPEKTFVPWLQKLYSMLKPEGLLIFSVHDERLLDPSFQMSESGLYFHEDSEIDILDKRDYGAAFVTEVFVRNAIKKATGRPHEYHRIKRVMYYQDMYVLVNSDHVDFSTFKFEYGPGGSVDSCHWSHQDELCVAGWNVDITPGSAIEEIAIFVNGQLRQKCIPFRRRPDVHTHFKDDAFLYSGWECFCHVSGGEDSDLLTVTAKTTGGDEYLLYTGTIAELLAPQPGEAIRLAALEERVEQVQAQLENRTREFVDLESYTRKLESELSAARAPRLPWKRPRTNG